MSDPLQSLCIGKKMPLKTAWAYYLCAVIVFLFLLWLTYLLNFPWLSALPYLIIGILLNRIVLRNLVAYHPIYNTLSNVSNTKLAAVMAWPFFYLTILIKLAIIKYL